MSENKNTTNKEPEIGDLVKDKITGFTGILIEKTKWFNNCMRIGIEPNKLINGNIIDTKHFDMQQIEIIKINPLKLKIPKYILGKYLGDFAKDKVTGYSGIICAECIGIRTFIIDIGIQSQELEEDVPRDIMYFCEHCIDIIEKEKFISPGKVSTGGPMPDKQSTHKSNRKMY